MNGPLLIDYREPHSIKDALKDISTVLELPEGDYGVFAGRDFYLVERKAVGDFLNGFRSGQSLLKINTMYGNNRIPVIPTPIMKNHDPFGFWSIAPWSLM